MVKVVVLIRLHMVLPTTVGRSWQDHHQVELSDVAKSRVTSGFTEVLSGEISKQFDLIQVDQVRSSDKKFDC